MRDFLATTATLALVVATPAWAQSTTTASDNTETASAPQDTPAAADAKRQDDIIVTARRREESIRDVPGTINAVTGDQLDAKGPVAGTGDILSSVPGVRFNDVASENLAEVSIRGSGTARATGADSGVGLFVNGAYVGSSTLGGRNFKTLDYFDVARVESLEGPQGALYGRNSEFGVVNIVLAKPLFQSSGYVRDMYTFGLNQNRFSAVVNEPLSDKVAIRVGGEIYAQSGGFYYDPNHKKYYDNTHGWNGRAQIRYRSGDLDVNLLVDGQDLSLPSFVNSLVIAPGTNTAVPLGYYQSRYTLPHDGKDGLVQKVGRTMLTAAYDFGWAKLESTTMATRWRSGQFYGAAIDFATLQGMRQKGELGIYPFTQVHTNVVDRTLYQDLHLTGTGAGGKLNWIVGGEGLYQNDDYRLAINSSPCAFTLVSQGICTGTPTDRVCLKPLPTSANCPAVPAGIYGTDSYTKQRIYSLAAYASVTYQLGALSLTGEARISHDYKTATQFIYALYTTTYTKVPTTFVFKKEQPAFTATASYKIPGATGTLIYAKVGTGYRAGGVNNGSANAAAPNPFMYTYDNETTIGYEAGVKSTVTKGVFVRLSAYLSRTKDAITSINDGCTLTNACLSGGQQFNINGGTIEAKGLEAALDGRWKLAGGMFSLSANAATQRAHFVKVPAGVTGLPVLDSSVAQIPDWTMSASVDYRHPISDKSNVFVNFSYQGQRGGIQDTVTATIPAINMTDFDMFGARAGFNFGKVQIAGFVRNLTDTQIQVLKFMSAGYPLSVRYNKPRTMGVSMSTRW
ncbi:TonB-dependent receptor [Sphingomonas sp. R-74633]|uniref:TonB-dependent receptor n=1 Tax=Sphingomonas sp. R-74633 TaxID=2751188 RepID=UPI0015D2B61E|nr:TonB-dependent receptor [Sphingomonas sp. R-74633]NYT42401.1 TonB-dependent receptor [Sphingomonas sp. R-74633]